MGDGELLAALEQARRDCAVLEAQLAERAARESRELALLTGELEAVRTKGAQLEAEARAVAERHQGLSAEREALRPGLFGWRLYRARLVEPALQAAIFFGCFFVWAWGKGHGDESPTRGLAVGAALGVVVVWLRRRGPAHGQ
jgi:hypothetical protein